MRAEIIKIFVMLKIQLLFSAVAILFTTMDEFIYAQYCVPHCKMCSCIQARAFIRIHFMKERQ